MTQPAIPLIAQRVDSTEWFSGIGIAESIDQIIDGVNSESWLDTTLGGVGTVAGSAGWVLDPIGSLITAGFGWTVEHVEPLSWALDQIAGDPDQIAANARTWRNVAAEKADLTDLYRRSIPRQIPDWGGLAADAYRSKATETVQLLTSLAKAADAMALIVEISGALVAMVRELVRDLIGEVVAILIARIPLWTVETVGTFGIAAPYVEAQVTALVSRWAAKISRLMKALIESLRRLLPLVRKLDEIVEIITGMLKRSRTHNGPPSSGSLPGHSLLHHSDLDPLRTHGPARTTHPIEWDAAIRQAEEMGVEVLFREGAMAYGPGVAPGRQGQLILDPDSSYGALLHEMSHLHDDAAAGWPGFSGWFDSVDKICENEYRAYQKEIDYAISIGDLDAVAKLTRIRDEAIAKIREEW